MDKKALFKAADHKRRLPWATLKKFVKKDKDKNEK